MPRCSRRRFLFGDQPNGLADQDKINDEWRRMSRETGIPLVATGDCHYIHERDAKAQEVLMAIQLGPHAVRREAPASRVSSYYLKSAAEFSQHFHDIPKRWKTRCASRAPTATSS